MISSIVNRLSEAGTPFSIIGGAGGLSKVKDRPPQLPAVYVYIGGTASSASERINTVFQRSSADISVVIITENLSDVDDFNAAEDIENLKAFVSGKLLGFLPEGASDPLEHVTGELQQTLNGVIWFEEVYSTARYIEEQD